MTDDDDLPRCTECAAPVDTDWHDHTYDREIYCSECCPRCNAEYEPS